MFRCPQSSDATVFQNNSYLKNLKSIDVSITAAVSVKPSTIYSVYVENRSLGKSWCLRRKYSDFLKFREELLDTLDCKQRPCQGCCFSFASYFRQSFPKKVMFGSRRPGVVAYRVVALEEFLIRTLQCAKSEQIQRCTFVKDVIPTQVCKFLGCAVDQNQQLVVPLVPMGRLLAGRPLRPTVPRRTNSSQQDSQHWTDEGTLDLDDINSILYPSEDQWSIAGDAVGLWAKGEIAGSNPEASWHDSGSSAAADSVYNPIVFREILLD